MNRLKNFGMMTVGVLLGIAIAPVAARAAENFLQAYPSSQVFYVDGQRVELEAYGINGSNYVKLRDIGQAVGFNVYYDGAKNAAMMETGVPYTGIAPQPKDTLRSEAATSDYSKDANPAIFSGEVTKVAFDGIHSSIEAKNDILSGKASPIAFSASVSYNSELYRALTAIGLYPRFTLESTGNGMAICSVKEQELYKATVAHTQPFVDGLKGLSEAEKVRQIVGYVCDRMTYGLEYPFVTEILSQDGQVKGCCMAYAYCVQFLCNRANIPCVFIQSDTHQWNRVYVDGKWWSVDATSVDAGDGDRTYSHILCTDNDLQGAIFTDRNPGATRLAQELLVPGSTK